MITANRTEESWGPLAATKCTDKEFERITNSNHPSTKNAIKEYLAKKKRSKKYRVRFTKEWISQEFIIEAVNEYDLSDMAKAFFNENSEQILFKENYKPERGYSRMTYTRF